MKLINGNTLEEAFEILAKPLKKSKSREGGKSYWTIEEYYCRMAEAFGAYGYSVQYQLQQPFVFGNTKQVMFTCQCTINIYGENGNIIYSTMGCGGKQVDRLSAKEDGRVRADEERYYTELNNLSYNVQVSAFKSACKSMNIFGALSGADNGGDSVFSSQSSQRHSEQSGSSSSGGSGSSSETISFYVEDVFKEDRKDGNTGMPVYSLLAHRIEGERCCEKKDTIIFYPNKYKAVKDNLYACMDRKTPYRITMKVKVGSRGGYIFDGFVSS